MAKRAPGVQELIGCVSLELQASLVLAPNFAMSTKWVPGCRQGRRPVYPTPVTQGGGRDASSALGIPSILPCPFPGGVEVTACYSYSPPPVISNPGSLPLGPGPPQPCWCLSLLTQSPLPCNLPFLPPGGHRGAVAPQLDWGGQGEGAMGFHMG